MEGVIEPEEAELDVEVVRAALHSIFHEAYALDDCCGIVNRSILHEFIDQNYKVVCKFALSLFRLSV